MSKHLKYAKYLFRHKWFVFLAGRKTGVALWRLIVHDWSKFLPSEWLPYANYFHGGVLKCMAAQARFDYAWLHHQKLNPHHWQYWVLREDSGATKLLEIPPHFVREMVADWMGAGRAITGKWDSQAWYERNKEKILLYETSRSMVEMLLETYGGSR